MALRFARIAGRARRRRRPRGTWRDFEADRSGGVLALIEHVNGCDKAGALRYLVDARLIDAPAGPDARPAAPPRPAAARVPAPNRPATAEIGTAARGSPAGSALRRPVSDPRGLAGTSPRPESAAPALAPPAPKSAPTADVAAAILAAAVPADDTPARAYLAAPRGTWPADGPPLPAAVRWLPPSAWEHLPTWPGRDGRPRRLTPPADGIRSLRAAAPPVPRCGALVYELARPDCAPDAVQVEPVTADGRRLKWTERPRDTKRTPGNNGAGRVFEIAAPPGDGWPDAGAAPLVVAVVEGEADGLALARLRLPGVLIRAAGGTAGMIGGAAVVRDLASGDGRLPGERRRPARSRRRGEAARLLRGGAARRPARDPYTAEQSQRTSMMRRSSGCARSLTEIRCLHGFAWPSSCAWKLRRPSRSLRRDLRPVLVTGGSEVVG